MPLPSFLALGCVSALAFAGPAQAQEAEQGRKLGGMTVTDTAITEEPGRTLRYSIESYAVQAHPEGARY